MILSGKTIRKLGIITPHENKTKFNGVSFGESYAGYDIRTKNDLYLYNGYTTLAVSLERFTMPNNVLGIVHDKSTWARLGVSVQNTVIEPGWEGYLTLEIALIKLSKDIGTVRIKAGTGIAQVIFHYIDIETEGYEGKYQGQECTPIPALFQ